MKSITKHILTGALSATLIFGYSCKSTRQDSANSNSEDTQTEISREEIEKNVEEMVKSIPTPFEFAKMLNDVGARYVSEVLNSVNNVNNYFTEKSKALNLGVYGADLGYSTMYDKNEDTRSYMKVVKTLLDELKVEADYSYLVNENETKFLSNRDSIVNMVTNTFYEVYDFLNKRNSPELSAMMAAGTWIEGLYIATHISEDTYNNTEMVELIYNQRGSLSQIIDLFSKFKDSDDIQDLLGDLKILKEYYDETDGSLTLEGLQNITNKIESLRGKIIS